MKGSLLRLKNRRTYIVDCEPLMEPWTGLNIQGGPDEEKGQITCEFSHGMYASGC